MPRVVWQTTKRRAASATIANAAAHYTILEVIILELLEVSDPRLVQNFAPKLLTAAEHR